MEYSDIVKRIEHICSNYTNDEIGGWITGDGPIPSDIMFIGEAPGKTEVEMRKPFVGSAGNTFEKYLNSIGLKRENIRISNACFFRPITVSRNENKKESVRNRTPKVSEINLFKSVLDDEISLVNPKIIITLGNIPLKRLTNLSSIGICHGKLYFNPEINRTIFPMYHPSSLTYNRNDEFKRKYEEDWLKLKHALEKRK